LRKGGGHDAGEIRPKDREIKHLIDKAGPLGKDACGLAVEKKMNTAPRQKWGDEPEIEAGVTSRELRPPPLMEIRLPDGG